MMDASILEKCKMFSCHFLGDTKLDHSGPCLLIQDLSRTNIVHFFPSITAELICILGFTILGHFGDL
jgi:hypothetical protein